MLLQTMVLISFLIALSGIALGEAALMVQSDRAHRLASLVSVLSDSAIEDARQAVADQQANPTEVNWQSAPLPRETMLPLCVVESPSCFITVREAFLRTTPPLVHPTTVTTPLACTSATLPSLPLQQVCNLQQGGEINEGRTEIVVRLTLGTAQGSEIASTEKTVRLRTMLVPPYALIVGIADPLAASPVKGTGDIGGIPSTLQGQNGTLIETVDPCRKVPVNSPVGITGEGLGWGNWQGTEKNTGVEVVCLPGAGNTSLFTSAQDSESPITADWSQ